MFLQELGKIEAEAFLTLASEMIQDDGIVSAEEEHLLEEYEQEMHVIGFTYDETAAAAARDTLAQLDSVLKRKVYMELFSIAICDNFEDVTERRTLNTLRDALELDDRICHALESCVYDLYSVYAEIDDALEMEKAAVTVAAVEKPNV